MPIIDPDTWQSATGVSATGSDLTALAGWTAAVDAAVRKMIRPFLPDPQTLTLYLDAPPTNKLISPVVPIRSITSIHLRYDGAGVDANYTEDYLLAADGTEYALPLDWQPEGYSRAGIVYRRGSSAWGYERRYPAGRLAPATDPNRLAIKLVGAFGPASVPDDIVAAATIATTLLYSRRETGVPLNSESWNSYSYGASGPFTAAAAVATPDVLALLAPYLHTHVAAG
jgi:hypothetical protein